MPDTVIDPPRVPYLPVVGTGALFPVRRVYCIGRNYAAHAVEMGHDPDREDPFFFQKNPDNLDPSGVFPYPSRSQDVHHEAEMMVALKSGGRDIPVGHALDHVFGYGLSLDMTRRDLQGIQKKWAAHGRSAKPLSALPPAGRCIRFRRWGTRTEGGWN